MTTELFMTDIDEVMLLTGPEDERRKVTARLHRDAQAMADDYNEPVRVNLLGRLFIEKKPSDKAFKGTYPTNPDPWIY